MKSGNMSAPENEINTELQITLFSIVGCISFLCNSLIFLVIGMNRKLHTKTNYLLISLALTDWLIIVVGIPFNIVNLLNKGPLKYVAYCNTTGFLVLVPFLVSNFNMGLIAIHRYVLIVKNRSYKTIFSTRNIVIAITFIWLCGILLGIPPLFGWSEYKYNEGRSMCMISWESSRSYLFFVQIIAFPLPIFIMVFSYYKVISHSYASRKRLRSSADRHNLSKQTRELTLTLMLLLIVCVFTLLFLPYAVIIYLEGIFYIVPSPTLNFLAILLAYSNSMFDFWIYAAMSAKFRRGLLDLFLKHTKMFQNKVYPTETSSSNQKVKDDLDSENSTPELSTRRRSVMNLDKTNYKDKEKAKVTPFYKTDALKSEYDDVSNVYIGRNKRRFRNDLN